MTVPTTTIYSGPYTGNGVTTVFNYDWTVSDSSELKVYLIDSVGTATLQTETTHYSVQGVRSDTGRTITMVTAPASTETLLIQSNFELTQNTDFVNQGAFYPEIHEAAFDKLTHLIQQLNDRNERALQLGQTVLGIDTVLPDPAAGYLIGWDSPATRLANIAPGDAVIFVGTTAPDETAFPLWYDQSTSNLKFWDGAVWQSTSGTDITAKADKVTGAVVGNLAGLDAAGNLTDSGIAPASKEDALATGTTADITGNNLTPKKFAGDQINAAITAGAAGVNAKPFLVYSAGHGVGVSAWEYVRGLTKVFDVGSWFDTVNSQFKPTEAGYYLITVIVKMSGLTRVIAGIEKSGSMFMSGADISSSYASVCTGIVYLNGSTDYVRGMVWVTGGNVVGGTGPYATSISGIKVAS